MPCAPMLRSVRRSESRRSGSIAGHGSAILDNYEKPLCRAHARARLWRAPGAGLSQQADPRGHRLRPGRIRGRRHPTACQGARAAARPADHHREQARQRRRRGDGVHRQGAGRRLHALLLRQRTAHGRAAHGQGRLPQPQFVHPARPRLRQRQHAGGTPVHAVQEHGRRDRRVETRAEQVELRHLGRRRAAPSVGRVLQERHGREPAAHPLQGRWARR